MEYMENAGRGRASEAARGALKKGRQWRVTDLESWLPPLMVKEVTLVSYHIFFWLFEELWNTANFNYLSFSASVRICSHKPRYEPKHRMTGKETPQYLREPKNLFLK